MLIHFLLFNIAEFTLTVFTALTFFAVGWLYLDSWKLDTHKKTPFIRSIGFFILALITAFHATSIFTPIFDVVLETCRIVGLLLILLSLIREPVLSIPVKKSYTPLASFIGPFSLSVIPFFLIPASALLTFLIAITYLRKATSGLERQLKPAFYAFLLLSLAGFLKISFNWSDTTSVFWSHLLAEYGAVWIIVYLLELVGISILAIWIWGYIRFRLEVQLFISTVTSVLLIFLITTFFFTFLLLKNLEVDALNHLKTDVRVLQYSIERLQSEALANARSIAQDSDLRRALIDENSEQLYTRTLNYMLSQHTSFLTVAASSGKVLMRAEDKDRVGDNILNDPLVQSALKGNQLSTVVTAERVTTPEVQVRAAVPIFQADSPEASGSARTITGVVVTGFTVDSAFVDGVKEVTGLDATVFGNNTRAATTFVAPDGKSRYLGTQETNPRIASTVLEKGEIYVGASNVFNQPFYTAYSPLHSLNNSITGMLFVGKPQTTLLDTVKKTIDSTFLGSIALMILSLIPAYLFSKFLKSNLKA